MSTATVWNDCIGKLKFILPVTGSARGQSPKKGKLSGTVLS